jgi:hypothetical protein
MWTNHKNSQERRSNCAKGANCLFFTHSFSFKNQADEAALPISDGKGEDPIRDIHSFFHNLSLHRSPWIPHLVFSKSKLAFTGP